MISFRYHIVSIVGVFLALAVGIVIGTTALNGPVTQDLRNQVKSLKSDRSQLSGQVQGLQSQVDNASQFAATFGAALVKDRLKSQSVLMVVLPGATTGLQDSVANQITAAGAALTGKLQLTSDFVDQSGASSINSFVTVVHPPDLTLPQTSDARVLAAALLSFVLAGKGAPTDLSAVLTGFAGLHMITSDPSSIEPATNIVFVGSGAMDPGSYSGVAELDLATAFTDPSVAAHVVVAGDSGSAKPGGIVGLVRGGSARSSVSTVDDADTPFGPSSVVLVVQGALNSQVGHYGTAEGADGLFPNAG
ncbi:MAG TPA: copper transporter [Jatrophihabitans sp.]